MAQLEPLADRLTAHQREKREEKHARRMWARDDMMREVARSDAQVLGRANSIAQAFHSFVTMNTWGRLRWLVLGADYVNRTGSIILLTVLGLLVLGLVVFAWMRTGV